MRAGWSRVAANIPATILVKEELITERV